MNNPPGKRTIVGASAAAFLIAVVLLLTAILPAEYGWDPLGAGAALGVLGMTGEDVVVLHEQGSRWHNDRIEFQLAPFEAVEYKYRLRQGSTLLFQWRADGDVLYDMHAEPDGAAPGFAESFAKSRASAGSGSYTAPFSGIHGWFWQNRGDREVTLLLETSGFFTEAIELRDGHEFHYDLEAVAVQPP